MRTREDTARFVEQQFDVWGNYECKLNKAGHHHYGKQDARELLDFIFGGEPQVEADKMHGKNLRNGFKA